MGRWKLSKGVTVENIRKIRAGMDVKDVVRILGDPLSVKESFRLSSKPVEANLFSMKNLENKTIKGNYLLSFSKELIIARWYPTLWVYIENGKVISVSSKRYYLFFDDYLIYFHWKDGKWESPLFVQSFPKGKDYKEEDIDEFLKERGIKVD